MPEPSPVVTFKKNQIKQREHSSPADYNETRHN